MFCVCCGIRMIPGKHTNNCLNHEIQAKTLATLLQQIRLLCSVRIFSIDQEKGTAFAVASEKVGFSKILCQLHLYGYAPTLVILLGVAVKITTNLSWNFHVTFISEARRIGTTICRSKPTTAICCYFFAV
jgi:hypothetical protein